MRLNQKKIKNLPTVVKMLLNSCGGWLVGSAAEYLLNGKTKKPKDYDIFISLENWNSAVGSLDNSKLVINSMAGLKYTDNNVIVDLWPDSIERYVTDMKLSLKPRLPQYMINLKTSSVLVFLDNNDIGDYQS